VVVLILPNQYDACYDKARREGLSPSGRPGGRCEVQPSNEGQPSWQAELIIEMELLQPGDPARIEQPTWRAELKLKIEPFAPWGE
jgi:hypothetical protein